MPDHATPPVDKPLADCSWEELALIVRGDVSTRLQQLEVPWTEQDWMAGAVWASVVTQTVLAPWPLALIYGLAQMLRASLVAAAWSPDRVRELGAIIGAPTTARQRKAANHLRRHQHDANALAILKSLDAKHLPQA